MISAKSRLRKLEDAARGGRCPECGLLPSEAWPGRIVVYEDSPAEGFPDDPEQRCSGCARRLWCVLRVVYDPETVGGGREPR